MPLPAFLEHEFSYERVASVVHVNHHSGTPVRGSTGKNRRVGGRTRRGHAREKPLVGKVLLLLRPHAHDVVGSHCPSCASFGRGVVEVFAITLHYNLAEYCLLMRHCHHVLRIRSYAKENVQLMCTWLRRDPPKMSWIGVVSVSFLDAVVASTPRRLRKPPAILSTRCLRNS